MAVPPSEILGCPHIFMPNSNVCLPCLSRDYATGTKSAMKAQRPTPRFTDQVSRTDRITDRPPAAALFNPSSSFADQTFFGRRGRRPRNRTTTGIIKFKWGAAPATAMVRAAREGEKNIQKLQGRRLRRTWDFAVKSNSDPSRSQSSE